MNAYISAVGIHLPSEIVTNKDLETVVDTSDEWIRSRSGIEERRIERNSSLQSSDLGALAAKDALNRAGIEPAQVDAIIAGSMYPDFQFPAMGCLIQKKIGAVNAFAYDITAACAFIPFALNTASLLISSGQARHVLVVGAEISSRIMDWTDRNTCVLFGDGAGAILLSATAEPNRGFLGTTLKSDGNQDHILYTKHLGGPDAFLRMDGKAVFKLAVTEMAAVTKKTLEKAGLTPANLDLLVPHQANIRILEATAERLGIAKEKVVVNVQKYGNTSSASIPLALREAQDSGRLKTGDLFAMVAVGGGMAWGCNLFRW